uniref:RING-type domain-containing protein n=1 Tax=Macrostomum lignano TaxID=282301 RepID=A0A1I8IG78_9PLAT
PNGQPMRREPAVREHVIIHVQEFTAQLGHNSLTNREAAALESQSKLCIRVLRRVDCEIPQVASLRLAQAVQLDTVSAPLSRDVLLEQQTPLVQDERFVHGNVLTRHFFTSFGNCSSSAHSSNIFHALRFVQLKLEASNLGEPLVFPETRLHSAQHPFQPEQTATLLPLRLHCSDRRLKRRRSQDCLLPAACCSDRRLKRSQDCLLPAACCSDRRLKRRRSQDCLLPAACCSDRRLKRRRSQDCLLPALAAVTAGSSGDDRRTVCCLPLAAVTAGSLLRVLSSTSVEMRLSNVHYAAADAQDAECNQDPREVKEDDSDDFDIQAVLLAVCCSTTNSRSVLDCNARLHGLALGNRWSSNGSRSTMSWFPFRQGWLRQRASGPGPGAPTHAPRNFSYTATTNSWYRTAHHQDVVAEPDDSTRSSDRPPLEPAVTAASGRQQTVLRSSPLEPAVTAASGRQQTVLRSSPLEPAVTAASGRQQTVLRSSPLEPAVTAASGRQQTVLRSSPLEPAVTAASGRQQTVLRSSPLEPAVTAASGRQQTVLRSSPLEPAVTAASGRQQTVLRSSPLEPAVTAASGRQQTVLRSSPLEPAVTAASGRQQTVLRSSPLEPAVTAASGRQQTVLRSSPLEPAVTAASGRQQTVLRSSPLEPAVTAASGRQQTVLRSSPLEPAVTAASGRQQTVLRSSPLEPAVICKSPNGFHKRTVPRWKAEYKVRRQLLLSCVSLAKDSFCSSDGGCGGGGEGGISGLEDADPWLVAQVQRAQLRVFIVLVLTSSVDQTVSGAADAAVALVVLVFFVVVADLLDVAVGGSGGSFSRLALGAEGGRDASLGSAAVEAQSAWHLDRICRRSQGVAMLSKRLIGWLFEWASLGALALSPSAFSDSWSILVTSDASLNATGWPTELGTAVQPEVCSTGTSSASQSNKPVATQDNTEVAGQQSSGPQISKRMAASSDASPIQPADSQPGQQLRKTVLQSLRQLRQASQQQILQPVVLHMQPVFVPAAGQVRAEQAGALLLLVLQQILLSRRSLQPALKHGGNAAGTTWQSLVRQAAVLRSELGRVGQTVAHGAAVQSEAAASRWRVSPGVVRLQPVDVVRHKRAEGAHQSQHPCRGDLREDAHKIVFYKKVFLKSKKVFLKSKKVFLKSKKKSSQAELAKVFPRSSTSKAATPGP